jgi:hypothetical protein
MAENEKPDTLMVFSGKSLNTMIRERGCGHWVVDEDRARRQGYLVVVRNHHAPWSEYDIPHGVAWLVATIQDVVRSPEDGRCLIKLGKYAITNKARPWGSRNPVGYSRLERLEIDPATLEWKDFPESHPDQNPSPAVQPRSVASNAPDTNVQPLTFEQARLGLAAALGVRPEQIEITVRA